MDHLNLWIERILHLDSVLQSKLLTSLLVIVGLWLANRLVRRIVVRRTTDLRLRYNAHKSISYISFALGLVLLVRIWFEAIHSVYTFLGLLSAGLAIALKDPIVNIFGWIFILWRRPFVVGDRIEMGAYAGDVIDIRVFQFSILEIKNWVQAEQSTGRVVHVPNGKIFSVEVANYTQGLPFIWTEVPVPVTFESNWRKAKSLLQQIADRHALSVERQYEVQQKADSLRYVIVPGKQTPIVYTHIAPDGVLLTIRCPTHPRERRATEEAICEDILDAFGRHSDIYFAYPTRRLYTLDLPNGATRLSGSGVIDDDSFDTTS